MQYIFLRKRKKMYKTISNFKAYLILFTGIVLPFVMVSCSDDEDIDTGFEENGVVAATGVSIVADIRNIREGNTTQWSAEIEPPNATNKTIVWSSDNPAIATVDQTGLIQAVGFGTVQITATLEDNTAIFDAVALTVNDGAFVTTWDNTTEIIIPTDPNFTYNYEVDWDNDGVFDETFTGNAVKSDFATTGPHTIRIRGQFPAIQFGVVTFISIDSPSGVVEVPSITFSPSVSNRIVAVNQWGGIKWESMVGAFASCSNVRFPAIDVPDLSGVNSMVAMFAITDRADPDVSQWDVSNVTDMRAMFSGTSNANPDMRNWLIPNVTNMRRMFSGPIVAGESSASALSPENYSAALVNFASQPTQDNVALSVSGTNFCNEQNVVDAKAGLRGRGWIIADAGPTDCATP